MRTLLLTLLLWCGAGAFSCAATVVIGGPVQNGNFERRGIWGGGLNWDGQFIVDPARAFEGTQFLEASSAGQRFSIDPGNGLQFELSFFARSGSMPFDNITLAFTSPYTSKVPELMLGETPAPSDSWQRYTATFDFEQPWSKVESFWYLKFEFFSDNELAPAHLDAVTLRQVPEPGVASLVAFGALIFSVRSRPVTRNTGRAV